MRDLIRHFLTDRSGATAIEYGMIAALIALAIFVGVGQAGNAIEYLWSNNNSRVVIGLK